MITPAVSALVFVFFFFLVCSDIRALLLNRGAMAATFSPCHQCRNGVWQSTARCSGRLLCQMQISHYQKSAKTHTIIWIHIPIWQTVQRESFMLTGPHPGVWTHSQRQLPVMSVLCVDVFAAFVAKCCCGSRWGSWYRSGSGTPLQSWGWGGVMKLCLMAIQRNFLHLPELAFFWTLVSSTDSDFVFQSSIVGKSMGLHDTQRKQITALTCELSWNCFKKL